MSRLSLSSLSTIALWPQSLPESTNPDSNKFVMIHAPMVSQSHFTIKIPVFRIMQVWTLFMIVKDRSPLFGTSVVVSPWDCLLLHESAGSSFYNQPHGTAISFKDLDILWTIFFPTSVCVCMHFQHAERWSCVNYTILWLHYFPTDAWSHMKQPLYRNLDGYITFPPQPLHIQHKLMISLLIRKPLFFPQMELLSLSDN